MNFVSFLKNRIADFLKNWSSVDLIGFVNIFQKMALQISPVFNLNKS